MDKIQFYRVEDFGGDNPFLVNCQLTFSNLYAQIRSKLSHLDFVIYYHYKPFPQQEFGPKKLKQIVVQQPMPQPTFLIYDLINDNAFCPLTKKYGEGVSMAQKQSEPIKQYSIGQNGMIIFDNRNTSLLAASINHAASNQEYSLNKKGLMQNFNQKIISDDCSKSPNSEESLIRKVLMKVGMIKQQPTPKNLLNAIDTIKNIKTKEDLLEHIDRQYSDYDPKFAAYLQSIYIKYAILSGYRMHYIEPKQMNVGVIKYKFPNDSKVAIIGDFGTGLSDSYELLKHIIIQKETDIIIHLGDVYYAGTPNQYKNHIIDPLNKLRKQAAQKFNKNVLFFSIPGNHDYYSWGLPFLTFIANINEVKQITHNIIKKKSDPLQQQEQKNTAKQQASYFCLQSEDSKWQFIGLDTAYHDSNPMNQINGLSMGPRLRQKELEWFVDKMERFPGSTILLTHHQLFSIHDRLCGSMSKYQAFTCINPLLSAQLFKYLPAISCWFWGHQHSIMFFADDVMGVRKCRLLGNSSFHVFQKTGPYLRKKNFPYIPLIQEDQKYVKKYLPLNPEPDQKSPDCYFNLSYAFIDFSKQKTSEFLPEQFCSTLKAQYYCCPCYPQDQAKKKHFKPYLMYEQQIQPRANVNIITSQKALKNEHEVVGSIHEVIEGSELFIKSEIGLFADKGIKLSLAGIKYRVAIEQSINQQLSTKAGVYSNKQNQKQLQQIKSSNIKGSEQTSKQTKKQQNQQNSNCPEAATKTKSSASSRLLLDGDIVSFREIKVAIKENPYNFKKMTLTSEVEGSGNIFQGNLQKQERVNDISKPLHESNMKIEEPNSDGLDQLPKPPILQSISSLHSSGQNLVNPSAQQLIQETVHEFLKDILEDKKFEIRKHRILKDASLHLKFGDVFSLRQITHNQYLACHIGMYGGILKLVQLKPNEQPCLFMFVKDSKVKMSK